MKHTIGTTGRKRSKLVFCAGCGSHAAEQILKGIPFHVFSTHDLADIISTVEFDHTGDYLATGDKGGRVVLFERNEGVSPSRRTVLS